MKRVVVCAVVAVVAVRVVRRFLRDPWVSWGLVDPEADAFDAGPLDIPDRCRDAIEEWVGPLDAPAFDPFAEP